MFRKKAREPRIVDFEIYREELLRRYIRRMDRDGKAAMIIYTVYMIYSLELSLVMTPWLLVREKFLEARPRRRQRSGIREIDSM